MRCGLSWRLKRRLLDLTGLGEPLDQRLVAGAGVPIIADDQPDVLVRRARLKINRDRESPGLDCLKLDIWKWDINGCTGDDENWRVMTDDDAIEAWFCREVLPLEPALTRFIRRNWRVADDVADLRNDVYALAIASA